MDKLNFTILLSLLSKLSLSMTNLQETPLLSGVLSEDIKTVCASWIHFDFECFLVVEGIICQYLGIKIAYFF